ncbi:hypothetical protein NN3_59870 [Nocardia neocaledoniensis NBRC 108232]|nr:hypothetical protein NN3_59870 [Nocardia neocaledoniensis NBRC 108232]
MCVESLHPSGGLVVGAGQCVAESAVGAGPGAGLALAGLGVPGLSTGPRREWFLPVRARRSARALLGKFTGLPRTGRGAGRLCGTPALEGRRVAGGLAVGAGHGAARVGLGSEPRIDRLAVSARGQRALAGELTGLAR